MCQATKVDLVAEVEVDAVALEVVLAALVASEEAKLDRPNATRAVVMDT
jgi:hypothetical protein